MRTSDLKPVGQNRGDNLDLEFESEAGGLGVLWN